MKRVVIHQPDFAPYLGFFDRLRAADVLVLLDDVQFQKGGWNHRDRIKTAQGPKWLTLGIDKGPLARTIREVGLAPRGDWRERNLNQIRESYRPAPFFDSVFAELEAIYQTGHARMVELNRTLLGWALERLALAPELVWASELGIPGRGTERLVAIVRALGGSHYLSGTGALDYLEPERFAEAGIALELQRFEHPSYPQLHGPFEPNLSVLDLLFNCGPSASQLVPRGAAC